MKKLKFLVAFLIVILGLITACRQLQTDDSVSPNSNSLPSARQWQRFLTAYVIIKERYVKPVSDQELIDNAINGMLEGLDPYSAYLDADALAALQPITAGEYVGIGVEVVPDDGAIKIITPLDGSPAQKAGLLPGDEIIEVNDQPIATMDFREAMHALRGPIGSKVQLTIARDNAPQLLKFVLVRTALPSQSAYGKLLEKNEGYLRIAVFQINTSAQVKTALNKLVAENHAPLQGLIIDLRNNPGGLLESAAKVSALFLDAQTISKNRLLVSIKDRAGQTANFVANANARDILHGAPIIVLINRGSASGAEVMAAALQDYHRATLVGTKTFGKGSVQTLVPLGNGALKMTTALYYTPSGRLIDHVGVIPNVVVQPSATAKKDVQLAEALALLQQSASPLNKGGEA